MNKTQKGFIFLFTLILTIVISLLIATSMQYLLLFDKAANSQQLLRQRFYELEHVTLELAQSIPSQCILHEDAANSILQKLIHREGCFFKTKGVNYYYLIENLGAFPCLVTHLNGRKTATWHYRISVIQVDKNYPAALLQIRFITASHPLNCLFREHLVKLGVSSWRYFASIKDWK